VIRRIKRVVLEVDVTIGIGDISLFCIILRPLILAILARKFLGTYRALPKHASIVFFDLREAANAVVEF